jgi:hypothetical protein
MEHEILLQFSQDPVCRETYEYGPYLTPYF